MPQIFKIAGYVVFFWANEGDPLEPVHVHICSGVPTSNATKNLDHESRRLPALP
jgi:hypothetical protein